jgi:hypothetical protein
MVVPASKKKEKEVGEMAEMKKQEEATQMIADIFRARKNIAKACEQKAAAMMLLLLMMMRC